jgi:hypothetical protein
MLPLPKNATNTRPKKKAATTFRRNCFILSVVWGGIEPPTQGFSVLCYVVQYGFIRLNMIDNQFYIFL